MTYNSTQPVLIEMVNTALDYNGYGIVNSLDSTPIVQTVLNHMNTIRKRFLFNSGLGWTWNVMDINPAVDVNGEILIPSTIINIISDNSALTIRNGRLFDAKRNTTKNLTFTELQGVVLLEYEQLPILAQEYIATMAAYKLAMGDGSSQADRTEIFQNAEIILSQLSTDEICRVSYDEGSQYLMDSEDYNFFTRRMNNQKL